MKDDKLIQEWLDQGLSTEEKLRMERFIAFAEKLQPPTKSSNEQAWETMMGRINAESTDNSKLLLPEKAKKQTWAWLAGAAAVVLIALFSYLNSGEKLVTHRAPVGELATFTLPDKSIVTLNAGSTLSFSEKNFEKNRWVVLSGEAFFDVIPGKEFKVLDDHSQVKVLGTSFNVYNRSNDLRVSVFTGRVEVSSGESSVVLNQGEEANLVQGLLQTREFNPNQTATWRAGGFYFDGEPLNKVIEELERQFGIEIETKTDISQRFYSGYFSKANMTEALQLVFVPMGLSVQTNGNTVTIE